MDYSLITLIAKKALEFDPYGQVTVYQLSDYWQLVVRSSTGVRLHGSSILIKRSR